MARPEKSSPLVQRFEPEVLALLGGLELKARYVVEGFLSGIHESPFHGFSVEFSDYRDYQPGDDLKHIDWRVYARTDRLCVKRFTAETNAWVYVVLDTSASMAYGGHDAWGSKFECARVLAAAMTWLLLRQNDAVGLVTLAENEASPHFVRPSQKPHQFGLMLGELERLRPTGGTRLPALLHHTARLARRRSIVLIISDLLEPATTIADELKELRFLEHECLLLQVLDRDELEFPFDRAALFQDLESGLRRRVAPRAARERYLQRFNAFMADHRETFRTLEMPHSVIRTDEDPWEGLAAFLVARRRLR